MVAAVAGALVTVAALGFAGMLGRSTDRTDAAAPPATGGPSTARIVAAASPAVVGITAGVGPSARRGSGIGVAEGFVATDAATVGGALEVTVSVPGSTTTKGRVVAVDRDTGLALVAVGATVPVLPVAPDAAVGDPVIALSARDGGPVVSTGVVSAVDRLGRGADGTVRAGLIGTDADLGASAPGALLLDSRGRLVGILTSQQGSPGAAAVPAGTVMRVTAALRSNGLMERGWLGVTAVEPGGGSGAEVAGVIEGGPADRAGLGIGDLITAVDGVAVSAPADLTALVRCHVPGERSAVTYVRDGARRQVTLLLSRAPRATTPDP